tara:strand:- start:15 stop:416 length:402 start_codon:yes stop_codon:yes gene_type:complete
MKTILNLLPNNLSTFLISMVIVFISLILFDFIYLSFAKNYYYISKNPINFISAILSWILIAYIISIQDSSSIYESIIYGITVGFVVYGVFNLVNYAILKEWKLNVVIMDIIWGLTVCSLAAISLFLFKKYLQF